MVIENNMTLSIKNMVCNRCIRVVKEDLEKLGYSIESIKLGTVVLKGMITEEDLTTIDKTLSNSGFEIIEDHQKQIIESIKTLVIEHIHHSKTKPTYQNFSDFLSQKLGMGYSQLSKVFSSIEGITIEKYIILQKIERMKELLIYEEMTLGEIAFELGYSSSSHASNQFKKVIGLSPSDFRKLINPDRKPIDKVNDISSES
ncbi:MAG: AraC family transcriptional regulator [Bacteroidia bacterium]